MAMDYEEFDRGNGMQNWKRLLFGGAAALSAVQFLRGNRRAALLAAGTGIAALATEYPYTLEALRGNLPKYLTRGVLALEFMAKLSNRNRVA